MLLVYLWLPFVFVALVGAGVVASGHAPDELAREGFLGRPVKPNRTLTPFLLVGLLGPLLLISMAVAWLFGRAADAVLDYMCEPLPRAIPVPLHTPKPDFGTMLEETRAGDRACPFCQPCDRCDAEARVCFCERKGHHG